VNFSARLQKLEGLLARLISLGEQLVAEKRRENDLRALTWSLAWHSREEAAARFRMSPDEFETWAAAEGFTPHAREVGRKQVAAYFAEQLQALEVSARRKVNGTSTNAMIALRQRRPRSGMDAAVLLDSTEGRR
jgi:hypothetical protein